MDRQTYMQSFVKLPLAVSGNNIRSKPVGQCTTLGFLCKDAWGHEVWSSWNALLQNGVGLIGK